MTIKGRKKILKNIYIFGSQKKENLVIMQARTITPKKKKKKKAALLLNSTLQLISLKEKKFQLLKILIFKK